MGMATPTYASSTINWDDDFYFYRIYPCDLEPVILDQSNAQAPKVYLDKNIEIVAPHKKKRRSKFKRR